MHKLLSSYYETKEKSGRAYKEMLIARRRWNKRKRENAHIKTSARILYASQRLSASILRDHYRSQILLGRVKFLYDIKFKAYNKMIKKHLKACDDLLTSIEISPYLPECLVFIVLEFT